MPGPDGWPPEWTEWLNRHAEALSSYIAHFEGRTSEGREKQEEAELKSMTPEQRIHYQILHRKPAGFLNVAGYYDSLRAQFLNVAAEGFTPREFVDGIVFEPDPRKLVARLLEHTPPSPTVKWIRRDQT